MINITNIFILLITLITTTEACNETEAENETSRCKPGMVLPVWEPTDNVSTGAKIGRAIVYFVALMYVFLGKSIVCDKFMEAIEHITSREKEVRVKKINGEEYTVMVRIWNGTVASLTLMALGSSAPEILISVIEICGNDFNAG